MVGSGHVLSFAAAAFVLIVIPGPSVLFVVGRALAHGRRVALATVLGNAGGNYLQAACVAVGIGTVLERSLIVFTAVKLAGALYLVWLGIRAVRARHGLARAVAAVGDRGPTGGLRSVREGFIVGATNPKSFILFAAVAPQFIDRSAGHVPAQMLVLGLVSIAIALVSDSVWGMTASTARSWFARSPRRLAAVGGAGGLAMIAVGATVAVTGRKD